MKTRLRWPLVLLIGGIALAGISTSRAGDTVPIKELPSVVREAVGKKFPAARPVSAERWSERNDYVYYTVAVQDGDSHSTVTVTEFGEVLPAKP